MILIQSFSQAFFKLWFSWTTSDVVCFSDPLKNERQCTLQPWKYSISQLGDVAMNNDFCNLTEPLTKHPSFRSYNLKLSDCHELHRPRRMPYVPQAMESLHHFYNNLHQLSRTDTIFSFYQQKRRPIFQLLRLNSWVLLPRTLAE